MLTLVFIHDHRVFVEGLLCVKPLCLISALNCAKNPSQWVSLILSPPLWHTIQHVVTSHLGDHVAPLTHLTEPITGSGWSQTTRQWLLLSLDLGCTSPGLD